MTNLERQTAFTLRLAGCSWQEIGERLGYLPQSVYEDLERCLHRRPGSTPRCVYPVLRRVLEEACNSSVSDFAQQCGISASAAYAVLGGRCPMTERMAKRIGAAMGLPPETVKWRREQIVPVQQLRQSV